MACNIFDSNGNRISSSEEFVKNLYEGKLDELIKSKKIDDSKFVKKITNESGFKKEYDKLETDKEKVNFVVELARKLVASGLDKTLLKNKISNILPNVVDKITDEAVGKFLGEKYSYNFLKGITGISKIHDRLKEWSKTSDDLVFKDAFKSVSDYDTIDMTNMNSIAEAIVNKHLKDGTIDELFSDIKNKQIDFNDAFRTSMAVMIAKNYAVDYAQAEVNGDIDTAKKLGEYIKYAKERSRLAGQGLSVLSVLNANSWEVFFGKILDDSDFNLEAQFTSPDGKIDEAGLNKIKEAFANIKETFTDDVDKAKFEFEKDDSDIDNAIKDTKKKRSQKKDTIKSIQLEVKDKLAALKEKYKSDKTNDRLSSLSSGFFGLTDADFKYGYEVVKVLVEAGLRSTKVLKDEIKNAFDNNISDKDIDTLMGKSDELIKDIEASKKIAALEKQIAKLNNDLDYIETNNALPPKTTTVSDKQKRQVTDKEQELINIKERLKEQIKDKIKEVNNIESERKSEEAAKQRKIREESIIDNINKAAGNLLKSLSEKTIKENNAAKEFALKLSKNLRQRMPDKARAEGKTTEEKLVNAIADMKFIFENASGRYMQELINAAINEVKQNDSLTEEQKTKALNDIDKYFGEVFSKPINEKQLDNFIKLKLKDLKQSLITLSGSERQNVIDSIVADLAEEVGFDEASDLANQIKESFLATIQKNAIKNLNDKIEKLKPKNNVAPKLAIVKYVNEEVLELINKGVLTDKKFEELLLKSIGISTLSAENNLLLAQAAKQLTEYPIGNYRNRHKQAFTNIINKIKAEDKKGGPKKGTVATIFDKVDIANLMAGYVEMTTQAVLSSVNTIKLAAFATTFKTLNQIYLNDYVTKGLKNEDSNVSNFFKVFNRTLTSPRALFERAKSVVTFAKMIKENFPVSKVLWKQFMSDGFNVFDSEIEANRALNWYSRITSGKQLSKDKNLNAIEKVFAVIKVLPVMSTRLLMSVDILLKASTTDYFLEHAYYNELITQDKTEQEILDEMAEFRNNLKISKKQAYELAKVEMEELKAKGLDIVDSDIHIRALEIMGQSRLMHDALLETKQQQKIATEQQEVEGSLGVIYNSFSSFKQIPLGQLTLRFMRSAANFTNEGLNYTPYGFVRAATKTTIASKLFTDKKSQINIKSKLNREKSAKERYEILSKALLGSAISVMFLIGNGGDEDEEKEKPLLYYTRKLCRIMVPIKINGQGWAAKGPKIDPRIPVSRRRENVLMAQKTDFEAGTIELGWPDIDLSFKMRTGMLPFGLVIDTLGNIKDSVKYAKEKLTTFDIAQMLMLQPIYTVIETTVGRLAKGISDQGSSYAVAQLIKPALPGGEAIYQDAVKYVMAATGRGEQEVLLKDESKGVKGFMKGTYLQLTKNTPATWVNDEAYDALGNKIRIDTKKLPLNGLNYILDLMISITEKEKKEQWIWDDLQRDKGVAIWKADKITPPIPFMNKEVREAFEEVNPDFNFNNTEYSLAIKIEYSKLLNKNKNMILENKDPIKMQEDVNDIYENAVDAVNNRFMQMPTKEQINFIVDNLISKAERKTRKIMLK